MPVANCPVNGCDFATTDVEAQIAAAQLTIHGMSHQGATAANVKIVEEMSESEWNEFKFNFNNYKRDAKIIGKEQSIRSELQLCCSESVRTRLYQMKGDQLNTITENDLLESIKKACVNKVTVAQHRSQFFAMSQTQGEAPQSHLARVRAKSTLSQFETTYMCSDGCAHDMAVQVSYAEDVVESQLIAGLINPDHKERLLLEADKMPTLDAKMA